MRTHPYPFSAVVGQPELKLALLLAAVDGRLSVLLRGDKGAGKSTAARALTQLLAPGAPFVNLPLGATEDRLLGGLDLDRALKGEPVLKPGLLSQAHGGVVYVDEVNLLPDHLADSLLDVAAGGVMFLEREGFSQSQECRFLLLGSMNPEEGSLRPQLLDRFALLVDVHAPKNAAERRCVVERQLRFEANPAAFAAEWSAEQEDLSKRLSMARRNLGAVTCPGAMLDLISETVLEHNVSSLRADLAVMRASIAQAALDGSGVVREEHVQAVLPLALAHRAKPMPPARPPVPPPPPQNQPDNEPPDNEPADGNTQTPSGERVFPSKPILTPRLETLHKQGNARGPVVGIRRNDQPLELEPRISITSALAATGQAVPRREDLHEKVREPRVKTRFLFVIDSSGSHAARDRMRTVKGAAMGLLEASSERRDEIALIAFRGASAQLVIEPTRSLEAVRQALEYLPTGGRTPLAHGLEMALQYTTPSTVLILLTDGRANVPGSTGDPWADALGAARAVYCPALVIDTEPLVNATGRAALLAEAMRAAHVRLDALGTDRDLVLTLRRLAAG
ncbi:MAG TPA: VWA domain-containing protein [Bryobacteraceae bacterium]|nr:VWA domain-containing protein [Bryobacteraceae bacterium]